MHWIKLGFKIPTEQGTDELNNPLPSDYEIKKYASREMGYSNNDLVRYDLKVTDEVRQFLTEAPVSVCQAAESVLYEGEEHEIKTILKYPRNRTLINLRKIRNEDNNPRF